MVNFLLLADIHNAAKLKANCLTFIAAHEEVMLTEEWEIMGKTRCELMIEASRAVALKNRFSREQKTDQQGDNQNNTEASS